MRSLLTIILFSLLGSSAFAAASSVVSCASGLDNVTTFVYPAEDETAMVDVFKDGKALSSTMYSLVYQDTPVEAWALESLENSDNKLAIVAIGDAGKAVALMSLTLANGDIVKSFNAQCELL